MDKDEWKKVLLGFLGIETQMAENLPEVRDMETLILYYGNTDPGSELRELVKTQIIKVLSEINDMETLMFYWRKTYIHWKDASSPSSFLFELHRLVNARIVENLPEINDMNALMSYREVTDHSSKSNLSVNARIIEVIKKATISDEWFIAMIKDRSVPVSFQEHFRQKATELLCEL